jgi:hypothetical protein
MRRAQLWGGPLLAVCLAVPAALAQTATAPGAITATPLAPPPGVTGQPLAAPTPPASTTPGQPTDTTGATPPAPGTPATPAPGTPAPADTTAPQAYTPAPPIPAVWQPQANAVLQVLDKIDAQATDVTVKVGSAVQYRSLTIAVRACDSSTKDAKTDATAFLDITDSHPDQPSFHGWIVKSDPSVSMLQHPIYDVRVLACHA